jgi:hypothetical protein
MHAQHGCADAVPIRVAACMSTLQSMVCTALGRSAARQIIWKLSYVRLLAYRMSPVRASHSDVFRVLMLAISSSHTRKFSVGASSCAMLQASVHTVWINEGEIAGF